MSCATFSGNEILFHLQANDACTACTVAEPFSDFLAVTEDNTRGTVLTLPDVLRTAYYRRRSGRLQSDVPVLVVPSLFPTVRDVSQIPFVKDTAAV